MQVDEWQFDLRPADVQSKAVVGKEIHSPIVKVGIFTIGECHFLTAMSGSHSMAASNRFCFILFFLHSVGNPL